MISGQDLLKLLWKGWKVIDDQRCRYYLFVSPDGRTVRRIRRSIVDRLKQRELVRHIHYASRPEKDQPGLDLTDEGLRAIGKPTRNESMRVERRDVE